MNAEERLDALSAPGDLQNWPGACKLRCRLPDIPDDKHRPRPAARSVNSLKKWFDR
ncbi:MAG: hypothetical protein R3C10_03250 [Pirellulales bacterium]